MKKKSLFFFQFLLVLGFLAFSGIVFYFFNQHAREPNPKTLSLIYLFLSLTGFFILGSFALFSKWGRAFFLFLVFVPLIFSLFGFQTVSAHLFFILFLGLTLFLLYLDRREKGAVSSILSRMESIETECNEWQSRAQVQRRRSEALFKKKERLNLLQEAIRGTNTTLMEKELSHLLVTRAASLTEKGDGVLLYFLKEDKQHLELVSESRSQSHVFFQQERLNLFHDWVLRNRQPLLIEDLKKEYRFEISSDLLAQQKFPKSLISIPLITEDKTLGVLTLYSFYSNTYTVEDLRLLSILTGFYTLSLSNARLYRETERLSHLDGLTQLAVRRYFQERFEQVLSQCRNEGKPLSLLMLDLDHFKAVNDTHGHLVGDGVLMRIAETLRAFSPQEGVVARYGGEEFAILLPGYSKKEALALAEKLRKEVAALEVVVRRKEIQVTLSIGVATFPDDGLLEEVLLTRADLSLYQAKKEGRNRVAHV